MMDKADTIKALDRAMEIAKDLERDIPKVEHLWFRRGYYFGLFIGLVLGAALAGIAWAVFG